jgi:hypothetical protein
MALSALPDTVALLLLVAWAWRLCTSTIPPVRFLVPSHKTATACLMGACPTRTSVFTVVSGIGAGATGLARQYDRALLPPGGHRVVHRCVGCAAAGVRPPSVKSPFACLSVCLSVGACIPPGPHLSHYVSTCLSICLPDLKPHVGPHGGPSACLHVNLSICLSAGLIMYLMVCLSITSHISLHQPCMELRHRPMSIHLKCLGLLCTGDSHRRRGRRVGGDVC